MVTFGILVLFLGKAFGCQGVSFSWPWSNALEIGIAAATYGLIIASHPQAVEPKALGRHRRSARLISRSRSLAGCSRPLAIDP